MQGWWVVGANFKVRTRNSLAEVIWLELGPGLDLGDAVSVYADLPPDQFFFFA